MKDTWEQLVSLGHTQAWFFSSTPYWSSHGTQFSWLNRHTETHAHSYKAFVGDNRWLTQFGEDRCCLCHKWWKLYYHSFRLLVLQRPSSLSQCFSASLLLFPLLCLLYISDLLLSPIGECFSFLSVSLTLLKPWQSHFPSSDITKGFC